MLDHAEFDADVLQYLTTMCPQLERLGARENVPLSLESVVLAVERCSKLEMVQGGRPLELASLAIIRPRDVRAAAPNLKAKNFMRVYDMIR